MPEFAYIARNASGQEITGALTAQSEREVLAHLGERALFPVKVTAGKPARAWTGGKAKRVKPQMLAMTLAQMGDLLSSGVPMLRSLDVLSKQASNPVLKEVLSDVRAQVAEGATLDAALARHPLVFTELTVSMVRAGGEGGFLEDVLKRTAGFIEQQEDLKGRVIGAATYPTLLAIAGFTATTVLIVFFVPKFAEMFDRLKQQGELPLATTLLLSLSDLLRAYGVFIVAALVGLGIWARKQLHTDRGRVFWDGMRIKAPVAGKIILNLAVSRFCRVLGTLLQNGVPILRSLEISSDSTGNRVLSAAIQQAGSNISSGQSLAKPLAASGLFPQTVVEMISVAEESNNLENVLVGIADGLDRRTERQLDLMVRLLEPAMLLVMAVVILFIVVALLLPVIQMSTSLH
jgi:general secretion pathway protein F/type IV pilus assembly protein PilC